MEETIFDKIRKTVADSTEHNPLQITRIPEFKADFSRMEKIMQEISIQATEEKNRLRRNENWKFAINAAIALLALVVAIIAYVRPLNHSDTQLHKEIPKEIQPIKQPVSTISIPAKKNNRNKPDSLQFHVH